MGFAKVGRSVFPTSSSLDSSQNRIFRLFFEMEVREWLCWSCW